MNNIEQVFKWERFSLFLKCYVGENRRVLFRLAMLILTIPTIFLCIFTWLGQDAYDMGRYEYWSDPIKKDPQHFMVCFVCIALSYVFASVAGSYMFSSLSNKNSRENILTLPASTVEKFVTLLVIYVVGYAVLMFLSVSFANFLRYALFFHLSPLLKPVAISETLCYFNHPNAIRIMLLMWGAFGVVISTFFTGSVLWPKNSYIKTTIVLITLFIVSLSLGGISFISYGIFNSEMEPRFQWMINKHTVHDIVYTSEFIYTIALTVFSYYRLKQWEIISRW